MKRLLQIHTILFVIFFHASCAHLNRMNAPRKLTGHELERYITLKMKELGLPGLSVAVVKDKKIIWTKGFMIL